MPNPSEKFEGLVLKGGWKVGPLLPRSPIATGGNFSQSYRAIHEDGRVAFVKALDFHRAFRPGTNQTQVLQQVTELFNFEVKMLEFCAQKRLDKIVRAIEHGEVCVDNSILGTVPYLVFEAADCDVRSHLDDPHQGKELAWKLRSLHHITTGLKQLHGVEVAHQDLKPSNVLVFKVQSRERESKIADLGRASRSNDHSPFDHMDWPGDPNYKPPEVLYSFMDTDWHKRRIAYDLYMLGSLMSFMLIRTTANAALLQALNNPFWPQHWLGTFDEVLPYLNHAFAAATGDFKAQLHPQLAEDLLPTYTYLCQPDPRKRGYPGQQLNSVALERFISKFDALARRADTGRYGST
jgi:eukaryotic-like serine/threonine-protein kinase